MKLIEFEGEIVEAGEGGVKIRRENTLRGKLRVPTEVEEEETCAAHLYQSVRVTVELIGEEPTS